MLIGRYKGINSYVWLYRKLNNEIEMRFNGIILKKL